MTRLLLFVVALAGACQSAAPAAVAPSPAARPSQALDQTVDQILDQARAATGGAAWAGVHRLHVAARLHAGGRDGRIDRWEDVEHGRFARASELPPRHRQDGFDGVSVWTSGDNGVPYALGDDDSRLGAIDTSYQVMRGWWFPARRPASRERAGTRAEGTRAFDLVRITPEAGRPFTLWIDRATHYLDRIVEPQGERDSVIRFADYRKVGALTVPFTVRQGDGDDANDVIETVTAVEVDPAIPDERFALPPRPALATGPAVTIPFRLENNVILIDVLLDGRGPYEADFDTGGSLIVPPAVVAELHLDARGANKITGGGEGFVVGSVGQLGAMSIGGAVVPRPAFDSFAIFPDHPRRLLVGLEILQHAVVRIDFDTQRLTLTPPGSFHAPDDAELVPFVFQDNQPLVTGAIDGIAGTFAVDTGDNGSLLVMAPFARRHDLIARYHATIPLSGTAIGATSDVLTRVSSVALNGADGRPAVRVDRPLASISTQTTGFDAHRYIAGNIGVGILRHFNVTFDYARQRILFERNRHYAEPDVYSRSGLRLGDDAAGLAIVQVLPHSPAVEAGLEPGEVVTAIDGAPARSVPTEALRALFLRPIGTRIALRVRGKAGERDVVLVLRDVI